MTGSDSVTDTLLLRWVEQWPCALAVWSRFVQLHEPVWCFTEEEETAAELTGSFAMIRLVDHSIVISLRKVAEQGLEQFAKEILAHEIGHHVYCPADLTDNARMLARMRVGLPTKEHLAPFISNLYSDLLINDRLQRSASLNMSGVYLQIGSECHERLWTLYMRIYELLWKLERHALAKGEIDGRLNQDAQLGARLVRSYAKDWLRGSGRFAALCLPYLLEDEAARMQKLLAIWSDCRCAGQGAIPDGLTEIDDGELTEAIHPAEDPELSGVAASEASAQDISANSIAKANQTGIKTAKTYRQPIDYAEVLKAVGVNIDPADVTARYYRERALPHLIPFPVRKLPVATDPLPEGLDVWDVGTPLEQIDWIGTLLNSPHIVPGVTTRERQFGTSPGNDPESIPVDLYLGVDCSGSMGNPAHHLSFPILAGAIIALSALRVGSRVKVVLSGEPGKTISTTGFERDVATVLKTLTSYLGTGTSFGIHRLAETFVTTKPVSGRAMPRPVHMLIVSDNDMFSMLDSQSKRRSGWEVAREALLVAGGGGTFVLELPEYTRSTKWGQDTTRYVERIQSMGWTVLPVSSMDELVEFARQFSRNQFGDR
ncbi:MAG: hypothetical protein KDB22_24100 [Planctomycetales bacterium]|nr:hypothetical protein [Planctomycetales bacterium]